MKTYEATEQAYKNGYEKGYADGKRDAVKHGRWINTDYKPGTYCKCSVCGRRIYAYEDCNYCPNCGADMRGEENA